jgi:hypothetical protein
MVPACEAGLVGRVIEEIWNAGDLDLADELFGATRINHGGLIPDLVRGHLVQAGTLTGETRISVAGGQIVESWTSWSAARVLEELAIFQRNG